MSLSRREVLQTFLGAPAALAACSRGGRSVPRIPEGEIVFPAERLGHRVRDRPPGALPEPGRRDRVQVAIIGGGVAGMAAAWRLAGAGLDDFVVLELDSVLGGTARSGHGPIGAYPWGAHYITVPMAENRAMVRLLREIGVIEGRDEQGEPVIAEEALCRDPEERLFYRGRWYEGLYLHAGESLSDKAQHAAFDAEIARLVRWRDSRGRRAFALPMAMATDDPEITALDRICMARWMDERGFTSPRLRWYVDYACRDDYGLSLEHTSAWAALFYYAARVRDPDSDYQPVITWPEGNGRLIAHLARAAGDRARTGWAVMDICPTGPGPESGPVDIVALARGGTELAGVRADAVILAAPQFVAGHVIRDWRDNRPVHVDAFDYGSWMVANLTLRERPRGLGFPLCWDNVMHHSPSLGYVVSTHQRGLDHGPTVITYYYPLLDPDSRAARRLLLQAGFAEWADVVLTDLERAHRDIRAITARMDIIRWGHAMIRPRPGFVWGGARAAAAEPYRGIHFAHSDLSGVALFEEAFDSGVRAAEEVLAARGDPYESWR